MVRLEGSPKEFLKKLNFGNFIRTLVSAGKCRKVLENRKVDIYRAYAQQIQLKLFLGAYFHPI